MQITINQNEIEQAITEYIESQVQLKDDQKITIDLKASRGPEGFTANIDIVKGAEKRRVTDSSVSIKDTPATKAEADKKSTPKAETETPKKEEPVAEKETPKLDVTGNEVGKSDEEKADTAPADTATNDTEADAAMDTKAETPSEAEETPAETPQKPVSLFSNLQKPTNK